MLLSNFNSLISLVPRTVDFILKSAVLLANNIININSNSHLLLFLLSYLLLQDSSSFCRFTLDMPGGGGGRKLPPNSGSAEAIRSFKARNQEEIEATTAGKRKKESGDSNSVTASKGAKETNKAPKKGKTDDSLPPLLKGPLPKPLHALPPSYTSKEIEKAKTELHIGDVLGGTETTQFITNPENVDSVILLETMGKLLNQTQGSDCTTAATNCFRAAKMLRQTRYPIRTGEEFKALGGQYKFFSVCKLLDILYHHQNLFDELKKADNFDSLKKWDRAFERVAHSFPLLFNALLKLFKGQNFNQTVYDIYPKSSTATDDSNSQCSDDSKSTQGQNDDNVSVATGDSTEVQLLSSSKKSSEELSSNDFRVLILKSEDDANRVLKKTKVTNLENGHILELQNTFSFTASTMSNVTLHAGEKIWFEGWERDDENVARLVIKIILTEDYRSQEIQYPVRMTTELFRRAFEFK
jgi:hypothetical protein